MKSIPSSCVALLSAVVSSLVCFASAPAPAPANDVVRFDMGTADSPLQEGFRRVTAADEYSPGAGFGWIGTGYEAALTEPPTEEQPSWFYPEIDHYTDLAGDLTKDHVKNEGDMIFRVDLADGVYDAILYLGDLRQPLGSMQVYANEELVRKNVQAKQWKGRAGGEPSYGNSFPVCFPVTVTGGSLAIAVNGDESDYRRMLEEDSRKPPVESFLVGRGGRLFDERLEKYQKGEPLEPQSDIGCPFVYNSIQGLEIYPRIEHDFDGEVEATKARIRSLVSQGKFEDALEACSDGFQDPRPVAILLLSLLGNPEYDRPSGDLELIRRIEPVIQNAYSAYPDDFAVVRAKMTFELFRHAVRNITFRTEAENGVFACLVAATHLEKLFPTDHLYHKGMIYRARALYMIDPHHWNPPAVTAARILRRIEKDYPQNRFVRLYLYKEWDQNYEWHLRDYMAESEGAPQWAASLREANNLVLDLAEWWIENKQQPDGTLGGGWGDDVELVGLFGLYANVSRQISEPATAGAKKLVENAWYLSGIDMEAGFFAHMADVQHTAEWTGDTLPMMLAIDYGNPVWLERAMKTGKLVRDLWTMENAHGYRSFRSNHIGATMVGGEDNWAAKESEANSAICLRSIQPLYTLYDYNRNPTLEKLLLELADGWLDAAMQTGKAKPQGIIPSTVSFPEVEMGGKGAPTWYDTGPMSWRSFFIWPQYRAYVVQLLTWAYQVTGDDTYLEPFRLAAEYRETLKGYQPDKEAQPGSPEWMAARLENHEGIHYLQATTKTPLPLRQAGRDKQAILDECTRVRNGVWERWPILTSESLMTDRVYVPGVFSPYSILTRPAGSAAQMETPVVTYENTGRDFAAYVAIAESNAVKLAIYTFYDAEREIAIRPWTLEPGTTYRLRMGPDADGDDIIDEVTAQRAVTIISRGQPVSVLVPGRQVFAIEMEQEGEEGRPQLLPDLAITETDIEYEPDHNVLNARVHNVGSAPVTKSALTFYDGDPTAGGSEIGRALIPHLPAPNEFNPQTLKLGVIWKPSGPEHDIYVVLDPEGELAEIAESNNVAHARFPFPPSRDE